MRASEREKRDGKRGERETGLAEEPQLFNYHFLTLLPGMVPGHTWLQFCVLTRFFKQITSLSIINTLLACFTGKKKAQKVAKLVDAQ